MTHTQQKSPDLWLVTAAAAAILLITIGMRMTLGLFVRPVVDSTELSIQEFSLIIAVFQLMWGVSQPLSGALADRFGAFKVLGGGALLFAAGEGLDAFVSQVGEVEMLEQGLGASGVCLFGSPIPGEFGVSPDEYVFGQGHG